MGKSCVKFVWMAALPALIFASQGIAFEWRKGENVTIKADEIINDDIYATAESVVLDGTINGDLVAFAESVTINGTLNGNLIAAGRTIIVKGHVSGNVRMAGAVLSLKEGARVDADILAAGAGLELDKGAFIGRDVVFAGALSKIGGKITRNVWMAGAGLEINGEIGGDVHAKVADSEEGSAVIKKYIFMPGSDMEFPDVKQGLTIDPSAKIGGGLRYTQSKDLSFPVGVIVGEVSRIERPFIKIHPREEPVSQWGLDLFRSLISMLFVGWLALLLFPRRIVGAAQELTSKPMPSLLWGFVGFVGLVVVLIFIPIATAIFAGTFALLGLYSLAGLEIFGGILIELSLVFAFFLLTKFIATIIVGIALGTWLLSKLKPDWAGHKFWPMVVGVTCLTVAALFLSLLWFVGSLISALIVLLGFGGLWLFVRGSLNSK